MKINLLIMFFLAYTSVFAQEIQEQFLNGLPKSIYNQDNAKEETLTGLNYYAKIHPDLIYFYLKSISKPDTASTSVLFNMTNFYIDKKNRWIDSLYNKISKQINNKKVLEKIKIFLAKYKKTPSDYSPVVQNIEKDDNLMAYLVCRYYGLKKRDDYSALKYDLTFDEAYQADFDYVRLKEEAERQERKNFYLQVEYSANLELINQIIGKYYLFNIAEKERSVNDISNVIITISKNALKIRRKEKIGIGIGAGYNYQLNLYRVDNRFILNYTDIELTANNSLSANSMDFGFSYLYRPDGYLSLFPHIRFNLYFMVNIFSDQKFSAIKKNKYEKNGYTYIEKMDYNAVTSVKKSYGAMFNISSPLYSRGKSFTFGFGLDAGIHYLNYKVNYHYQYDKSIGFWTIVAGEYFYRTWKVNHVESSVISSHKKYIFRISPSLNLNYIISDNCNIVLNGSYNFFRAAFIYQY